MFSETLLKDIAEANLNIDSVPCSLIASSYMKWKAALGTDDVPTDTDLPKFPLLLVQKETGIAFFPPLRQIKQKSNDKVFVRDLSLLAEWHLSSKLDKFPYLNVGVKDVVDFFTFF